MWVALFPGAVYFVIAKAHVVLKFTPNAPDHVLCINGVVHRDRLIVDLVGSSRRHE